MSTTREKIEDYLGLERGDLTPSPEEAARRQAIVAAYAAEQGLEPPRPLPKRA